MLTHMLCLDSLGRGQTHILVLKSGLSGSPRLPPQDCHLSFFPAPQPLWSLELASESSSRGPALPSSISVCHGWPFFSKDTCALSPMPPSSLTCQAGFSAMPLSFLNFRNIDKTTATLLIDSIRFKESNFLATKFTSHVCICAFTCKVVSHYMIHFYQ